MSDSLFFLLLLVSKGYCCPWIAVSALTSEFQFVAPVPSGPVHTSLLIFNSSVCNSLPWLVYTWLVCTITWGDSGPLFDLTCSVVQWWGGEHWKPTPLGYVGVLEVDGPQWACHWLRWHVFSWSTQPRFLAGLCGHCPKWALCFMHLPSLNHSGSWVFCKGTGHSRLCALVPS